ncbi:MAG TPA: hypothetical protein VFN23_00410, partial [Ktedonobacteraceae bacterium]|nr:hypothetical protein [Ktedonobacteraceae bacterium]
MVEPESIQEQTGGSTPAPSSPLRLILAGLALAAVYFMLAVLLPLPLLHFSTLPEVIPWQQLSRSIFATAWSDGKHPGRYLLLLSGLLLLLGLLYFFSIKSIWSGIPSKKDGRKLQTNSIPSLSWLLIIAGGAL